MYEVLKIRSVLLKVLGHCSFMFKQLLDTQLLPAPGAQEASSPAEEELQVECSICGVQHLWQQLAEGLPSKRFGPLCLCYFLKNVFWKMLSFVWRFWNI